ncbi:MAG TPA: methylated-DNA--[protein]-cysteine S-methyltransferase [Conexivisphaerales archaeon]|nr:methylated-DNA--[protein]-cysteine S-methyltransferase [Conexivisphaerales archaeon]
MNIPGITEPDAWHAVENRDRHYDDKFVFGAISTRIYCRPSCPSRRPRRDRVVFFPGPREAEASGFRACRRCKPDDDASVNPTNRLVQDACSYLESHQDGLVTLKMLGSALAVSPFHLQRIFKRALGMTPKQYSQKLQLSNAKFMLRDGQSVRRSTYSSGHSSTGWLYTEGRTKLGMRPGEYKSGGSGKLIRFATAKSSLGWVLVGCTQDGVCTVNIGSSEKESLGYLSLEFPKAVLVSDDGLLSTHLGSVLRYLDGPDKVDLSSLPLDIRATSLQYRVWKELQRIPYGTTATYGEIAVKIGSPSAVRAVANACAANPVALIIPCHRVVRKDGSLGGYRWGLERKKSLLQRESELKPVGQDA